MRIDQSRAYREMRRFIERMKHGRRPVTTATLNAFREIEGEDGPATKTAANISTKL